MSINPTESSQAGDSSILGFVYKNYDHFIGTRETASFISKEDRKSLLADLSADEEKEIARTEREILNAAIEKERKLHPEGSVALTALLQYRADNQAPARIKDIALVTVHTASSLGILDKLQILITSVIEAFTGSYTEGTEIYNKADMGFLERFRTRMAENGSKQFTDAFYEKSMSLAEKNGGAAQKQELVSLLDKAELQKIAFIKASGMVGAQVAENDPKLLPIKKSDSPQVG